MAEVTILGEIVEISPNSIDLLEDLLIEAKEILPVGWDIKIHIAHDYSYVSLTDVHGENIPIERSDDVQRDLEQAIKKLRETK